MVTPLNFLESCNWPGLLRIANLTPVTQLFWGHPPGSSIKAFWNYTLGPTLSPFWDRTPDFTPSGCLNHLYGSSTFWSNQSGPTLSTFWSIYLPSFLRSSAWLHLPANKMHPFVNPSTFWSHLPGLTSKAFWTRTPGPTLSSFWINPPDLIPFAF